MSAHPKTVLSKLAAFDRARSLTAPGDRILVAVSGGPDSVLLAHYLARLAGRKRWRLALAHIHHGLRGRAADADAEFVQDLGRRLGLPVYVRKVPVARVARTQNRSIEDAARLLRYRALGALARRMKFNKVAVGHQLDDQAETFLLHLLRGTKAKGLAGMPPKRFLRKDVELVRPLLAVTRADVLGYLKSYGLGHRIDDSNHAEKFTRNWVRRKVLPLLEKRNPRIREHLARIAEDVHRLIGASHLTT